MQLKDFISTALVDIYQGIKEAKQKIGDEVIAPEYFRCIHDHKNPIHSVEYINFEVCITTEDSTNKKLDGDLGIIKIVSASVGAKKESKNSNTEVNKLSFRVPYYPVAIKNMKE